MSTLLTQQRSVGVTIFAVLLLAGCSQTTTSPAAGSPTAVVTQPAAPPQVVPAKTAFWPMYTAAHNWNSDVMVLRVTAKEVPGYKNGAGKAAMWEAAFASPSLHAYRVYTYSIADVQPNIQKGVVAGLQMPWGGVTRDAMPIDLSLFTVDSDAAYQSASSDAADWLKKNPGKELASLEIGDSYKFQGPVWYLMWGSKTAGYAALVDANSGKVLKHK